MSTTKASAQTSRQTAKTQRVTKRDSAMTTRARSVVQNDSKYPRHSLERALRVAKSLLEQNAGQPANDRDAAAYAKVGYNGPFKVELSSGIKYGFLSRPSPGQVAPTELAKKALRPQAPSDSTDAMRQAILNAPVISDVYNHYRGENLPDEEFLENALVDKFKVPREKVTEFIALFKASLDSASLLEKTSSGKERVLDVSHELGESAQNDMKIAQGAKEAKVKAGDECFVMMPFAPPIGQHFEQLFDPAIRKAGLTPLRADNEIFGTGKIMDQIWLGINRAKVLLCELTGRNPNVFYELGLAHALKKPVVLLSNKEDDVPFDLKHIRVIYYDKDDPFWGEKVITKIAENILSALRDPSETTFSGKFNPES